MSLFKSFFKTNKIEIDYNNLPVHIAMIMDGNGRWAKKRGLSRSFGHREGSSNLKKIVRYCDKIGIKYLTVYAFSTENWRRPQNEVDTLMSLLLKYLKNAEEELAGDKVQIRVIGDVSGLPEEIQEEVKRVTRNTADNEGLILNIALNYGSKDELVNAVKVIAKEFKDGKLEINDICDELVNERLYTAGTPEPDLLIRTGGEKRLSNFLLWQSAYTEFWFTDVYWPDFDENELLEAIRSFQDRNRRFGGI
jgi:undecaprenyl diphosphate synthase